MKIRVWIPGIALLLLLLTAFSGWRWTRDQGEVPQAALFSKRGKKAAAPPPKQRKVDERPMLTAVRMASLADTAEEQPFARQAIRLANHDVDLAFADALREAALNPPPLTPEMKELAALKEKAEAAVAEDQQRIQKLTRALAAVTREQDRDPLEDQLDVAKAQLELDNDELEETSDDLERVGGDPQARIQRLKVAHEAAQKEISPSSNDAPKPSVLSIRTGSQIEAFRRWRRLVAQRQQLFQSQQEALEKVQRLSKRRDTLAQQLDKTKEERSSAKQRAAGFSKGDQGRDAASSRDTARATVEALKNYIKDQRHLADIVRRIQDEQELAEVYGNWGTLVQTWEQGAAHKLFGGLIGLLCVLLSVFLVDRLIEVLSSRAVPERLSSTTLATVAKFGVRIVGVLVIVFMVFGMPSQLTTVLGLAGAGLTVAMKDFIVAFFGWFVLMGRNGIRVGDWVEIKGVGGEVVEIGLLRTVLLETGSWSDAGHPTGRRAAFVNSFAIEGHYFNFSTSGQWMWDELSVVIPAGQDPYPIIDGVQKLVEQETQANAKLAEKEWQQAASRYRAQSFSAVPGINVVPTSSGIEIRVRYITRAFERHETRKALYQAVVELMHGKREESSAVDE